MGTPTLEGELVVLRPLGAQDAPGMFEMVSDPEGRRMTGTTAEFTLEQVERWCAEVDSREGRLDWAVTLQGADEYLGEIVLNELDDHARSANLRLGLRPGQRGRGLGREAILLVLEHAFAAEPEGLGLHRVQLDVLAFNARARALYDSLGFVTEGRLREAYRDGDFWTDVYLMAMLEEDYESSGAARR